MNSLNIPISGNPIKQKQQLRDIQAAMVHALFTHPGMAELIQQDPSVAQLQIIYLEAEQRLTGIELMEAMAS